MRGKSGPGENSGPRLTPCSAPGGSYIPPPNPAGDTGAGGHERGGPGGADPTAISGPVTTLVTSTPLGQVPTAAPAPTQACIIPICNSYAKAVSGDYCQKFAQANSITPDQLYAWNNILGTGGSNCSIKFFANYYYCVGVSGGTATSSLPPSRTTTSPTVPSPTQMGIPSYCNKYGQAQPGTSCSAFLPTKSLQTIFTPGTRSLGLVEPIATPNSSQDTTIARALQCRHRSRPEALATGIIMPRRWMGTIVSSLRRIKVSRRTNYILGTPCWALGKRTVGLNFSKDIGTLSGLMVEGFCCGQSWFLSRCHIPCQCGKKRRQARANLENRISSMVGRSWKTLLEDRVT